MRLAICCSELNKLASTMSGMELLENITLVHLRCTFQYQCFHKHCGGPLCFPFPEYPKNSIWHCGALDCFGEWKACGWRRVRPKAKALRVPYLQYLRVSPP
jgi:hypothetical protein